MRTILVDDEPWGIQRFAEECATSPRVEVIGTFTDPLQALSFARENRVDFALLDIEMPGMDGLELGQRLRELYPDIIVIYVTAYDRYAVESLRQKADYFILKPYSTQDVRDALDRAQLLSARQVGRVQVRTFGHFEVFVDGRPLEFKSAKAKELLALLVDRAGGTVSTADAFSTVWEDHDSGDAAMSLCRKGFLRLQKVLDDAGVGDILITNADGRHLDVTKFSCDYYDFLAGKPDAIASYGGWYLADYSWAEDTAAYLTRLAG